MSIRRSIHTFLGKLERNYVTHNHIEVSRAAILHNLDTFTQLSGQSMAIPVLKGNAYGHGVEVVARALAGRDLPYIAVDGYFEALRIREVSRQPVLIMGAILPENLARITYDNFAFVVQDKQTVRALGRTGKRIAVHIEANTGMNRYGASLQDIGELTKTILEHNKLKLEGVMSHLADSDGQDPATVELAVEQFDACVEAVRAAGASPTIFHIAQSAGSLRAVSRYANAFRLGVGLYGINPFESGHTHYSQLSHLRPALKLVSTLTKVIEVPKGGKVSYNYTFTAPKSMKIGVLPLGYYEGVSRALSGVGVVKIGEHYAPIVGRVCMNHTMINLEGTNAKEGDEVLVLSSNPGDANAINNLAAQHGLFSYNLLTALSADVRRILVT